MKRGQGEQFNWIFVIVAGSIILGFFTMFALKYINLQEDRRDARSIMDLGSLLNTLEKLQVGDKGVSINSNDEEGLRLGYDLDLKYSCNDNKAELFIGSGEFANYELEDEVVFIDSKQEVDALDAWILPWRFPFHVTNFIYLSDPGKHYYLVYDSGSRDYVNDLDIGRAFDVNIASKNELEIKDNSKYVFFTASLPSENEIAKYSAERNAEFVHANLKDQEVYFFKDGWQGPVEYYGDELMLGALFTNNLDNYQCNIDMALAKLKDTSDIYLEKAKILNKIGSKQGCKYDTFITYLKDFADGNYNVIGKLREFNGAGGCLWVF